MKLLERFRRAAPQQGECRMLCDQQALESYLKEKQVRVAAVLSDELAWPDVTVTACADLSALRRKGADADAVVCLGRDAARVSGVAAALRRASHRKMPLRSSTAEEDFPQPVDKSVENAVETETTDSAEKCGKSAEPLQDAPCDPSGAVESSPPTVDFPVEDSAAPPVDSMPMMLNIDDAIAAEQTAHAAEQSVPSAPVAVPEKPAEAAEQAEDAAPTAPSAAGPLFIVVVDALDTVPALAELPAAQPDAVFFRPALHTADAAALREAVLLTLCCGLDTLQMSDVTPQVGEDACASVSWALQALTREDVTGVEAAEHLLSRGHEGGQAYQLGQALHARYGLPAGLAMAMVLPHITADQPGLTEGLRAAGIPERLEALRLMDLPELTRAALHPAHKLRKPMNQAGLTDVLRSLYVPSSEGMTVEELCGAQERFFATGRTLPVAFRLRQLDALRGWMDRHESDIEGALLADLGKCSFEAYETEILLVREELKTLRRHLPSWQRDHRVRTPLIHFPARCFTVRQPYGRALIMSPWNYPFLLSADPLCAAIAGGNCVILKPSAYAPATSRLLREMVRELFDPEYVTVVEGGREQNASLLQQKFDTIFFTGSKAVGKLVMKSAADFLTPVTLELGGKSPCIVDESADVKLAARRICWGKFINAGQTCVAPDYVLCAPGKAEALVTELEKCIRAAYGEDPVANAELCRIVNEKHFHRLLGLMEGADVAVGGRSLPETLKLEPTVLRGVTWEDAVMQEEIFGPILPVLVWDGDFDQVLREIEARPRPLAAYLFTKDRAHETAFLRRLRFGGGCINDVLCHLATAVMPFGGVGESGMGSYHGRHSFDTFTHEKSILKKSRRVDIRMRYAPYASRLKWLRRLG